MKVVGPGYVKFWEGVDEGPHEAESHQEWNESVVILVWDPVQNVYLDFRLGHEANRGKNGIVALWNNVWVPGKYYKRYIYPELRPEDRLPNGFGAGAFCTYTFDGRHNWTMFGDEVSVELVMEDFCPGFAFWPDKSGTLSKDIAKNHIEAPGKVNGTVIFQGKTYILKDALAFRDHSWGVRKWDTARAHRWTPAVFGPDLTVQAITWYAADKTLMKYGFVLRGDEILVPNEVDVLSFSEADGITHRGGMVKLTMESGEVFDCRFDAIGPGGVSAHHGYPAVDTPCRVTLNNGARTGVGLIQAAFNSMGGTDLPIQDSLELGCIDNGIFDY